MSYRASDQAIQTYWVCREMEIKGTFKYNVAWLSLGGEMQGFLLKNLSQLSRVLG